MEYKMLKVHDKPTSQNSRLFLNDVSCMNFINCSSVYKCFKKTLLKNRHIGGGPLMVAQRLR
jgi:hypothetical protein